MKIILLTGIPGGGKTTIGNQLKNHYGFYHIDLEDSQINSSSDFLQFNQNGLDPNKLMAEINRRQKNAVITWGFGPEPEINGNSVLKLQKLGAKMFWFDGDRTLFKNTWKKARPNTPEDIFDMQIRRINNQDIHTIFKPISIDPFDNATKEHRNIEEIIEDIFRKVGI